MQKKSFQELASAFNTHAQNSAGNQDRMEHLSLRYALLTRHKTSGVDDAAKTELAQTMLNATIKFADKVIDYIEQSASSSLDEERGSPEIVSGWVEAPLTAMTAPEAIAYLPKGTAEQLSELALKAIDALADKPDGYRFHKDAYATMGQIVQTILTHADMIADHVKANELTADHLATKQPIVARKPILLKSKTATPAA